MDLENHNWQKYLAEFIGTFFLVFFGCSALVLSELQPGSIDGLAISIIPGATVAVMIYTLRHISGAHINPAVSIALWVAKSFPTALLPGYLISQFLGAIFASILVGVFFGTEGHQFGMTIPEFPLNSAFAMECLLSFIFLFVVVSVATDPRASSEMAGLVIGTIVTICTFVDGPLTGASMNPARSFGPALVNGDLGVVWLYILAPVLGGILAAIVYQKISHKNISCP
jgi:MIP family channel proteins